MKLNWIVTVLVLSHVSSALADAEFQIQCPGRPTMTIVRAGYGLSMMMWPQQHLLLAAGEKISHLSDGDTVSITQFRNGDELIRDRNNQSTFFYYDDSAAPVACAHTEMRELHAFIPTPYETSHAEG